MKNLIKINPTSFILGAVLGGLAIFTIAADSQRPTVWDYKVTYDSLKYCTSGDYQQVLNKVATNGWEVVSGQLIPASDPTDLTGAHVYVVLRHPKQ